MSIADDPQALAGYIRHLGGEILEGRRTFQFEIPLGETRRIVPEINKLGLQAVKIDEHTGSDINGKTCSIATIELRRQPEETAYQQERNLMSAIIR
jgi:hypothetical protein